MSKERLYIFDTTLRDGAQTQGVHFSLDEKTKIAHALDNLGVIISREVGQEQTRLIQNFSKKNSNSKILILLRLG